MCHNHCPCRDVEDVLIKILLHFRVLEFIVKVLVGSVHEGVGMIANLRGSVLKIPYHKF